jgi:hypothetical protein
VICMLLVPQLKKTGMFRFSLKKVHVYLCLNRVLGIYIIIQTANAANTRRGGSGCKCNKDECILFSDTRPLVCLSALVLHT